MAVKDFNLGHRFDNLQPVVRLFCEWVAKEIKLLQEGKSRQELQEYIQVAKLVVSNEKHLQELESADSLDALKLVILAVEFFNAEICRDIVQVL